MDDKTRLIYMLPIRDSFQKKVKIFHVNGNEKKVGVAILMSDKIDFKTKSVIKYKEGHYTMIEVDLAEDITSIHVHAPNMRSSVYVCIHLYIYKIHIHIHIKY